MEQTSDNDRIQEIYQPAPLSLCATEGADSDCLEFHVGCASTMLNICSLTGPG